MNALFYVIAVLLVIAWAVGYFLMDVGSIIHLLLPIAAIVALFGLIKRPTAI